MGSRCCLGFSRGSGRWIVAVLFPFITACSRSGPPCTNQISSEEISPTQQFKAVVFHRTCHDWGGTKMTTNVSILRVNETPADGNGNVMCYNGNVGVRADWLTEQRLAIYSFADLAKSVRLERVGGVEIEYPNVVDADIVRPSSGTPVTPSAQGTPAAPGTQ